MTDFRVIARLDLGEIHSYGKSEDDKLFWIQSRDAEGRTPVILLRVYGYRGSLELERRYTKAGKASVTLDGRHTETPGEEFTQDGLTVTVWHPIKMASPLPPIYRTYIRSKTEAILVEDVNPRLASTMLAIASKTQKP